MECDDVFDCSGDSIEHLLGGRLSGSSSSRSYAKFLHLGTGQLIGSCLCALQYATAAAATNVGRRAESSGKNPS